MYCRIAKTCFVAAVSILLLAAMVCDARAVERVRVETRGGVPFIVQDGKPVRSRMFFGGPGGRNATCAIDSAWRQVSFEFTPSLDAAGNATVHFRFGDAPGVVFLDDIEVTDLTSGKTVAGPYRFESKEEWKNWRQWPERDKLKVTKVELKEGAGYDGSSGLRITLDGQDGSLIRDFHIYHLANMTLSTKKTYRFSCRARGQEQRWLNIAFYIPGSPFIQISGAGHKIFRDSMRYAKEAGAPFVNFPMSLPWNEDGKVDWKGVDRGVDLALALNPDALLIPRIPMDAPEWWLAKNADHRIQWRGPNSKRYSRSVATVSSELYREEAGARLAALIDHLEEKYGGHFAGYMPCGQNTGEWFYQDTWSGSYSGYAPEDRLQWRKWLASHYDSDDALRKAWGDASVARATADVPDYEYRNGTSKTVFHDIKSDPKRQMLLDFNRFQQEMMSATVLHFAKICRQHSRDNKLVVFFFGYVFEFAAVAKGPAVAGHYDLRRVLDSPDIDILCSPQSYCDRQPGGYGAAMTAAESIALAGKLWLVEDDTRTHHDTMTRNYPGRIEGGKTLEASQNLLLRNTAGCATRNFATWWMDLFQIGWYDDPELWKEMKRLETMDNWFIAHPTPFNPETAMVLDLKSMLALPSNLCSSPLLYHGRIPFGRSGMPYGQYLLDDVLAGKTNAKVNAFLGVFRLSKEERTRIREKTAGKVNIWGYGAGALDTVTGYDPEAMRELTGFAVKRIAAVKNGAVQNGGEQIAGERMTPTVTDAGKKWGLGAAMPKISATTFMTVTDAKPDEILATYPDGSPAIAARRTAEGGLSVFVGLAQLTPDLLRAAARHAGAHVYTGTDCNVAANGPFIVLHGAADGPVKLDSGATDDLWDYLENKNLGPGPRYTLDLKLGQTKIFRVGK